MSSETVMRISTQKALKNWLQQLEAKRIETFEFLPTGSLAAKHPPEKVQTLVLNMMPLTRAISSTTHYVGGVAQKVICTMTYRPCVRMLDAFRTHRISQLPREERLALEIAGGIARQINNRRKSAMDKLYLLYSYIGALINYKKGGESEVGFDQLTSAAWALINKVANCQGFAEVMYLVGGMMGFRMGIQSGQSAAGGHSWNTIVLDGRCYAMDASSSAVARADASVALAEFSAFLMGQQEAVENDLTWTAAQESLSLSPSLDPKHDYYLHRGVSASTASEAAAEVWNRFMAGEKLIHLRIRGKRRISLDDVKKALSACAKKPEINEGILKKLGGSCSYRLLGRASAKATYVTVERTE